MKTVKWFLFRGNSFTACIVIVGLISLFTYLQTAGFPYIPNTDGIYFLPSAIAYAKGDGLINSYFAGTPVSIDGRLIGHGFLFPLLLGGLFKANTYEKISNLIALINASTIVLLGFALVRATTALKSGFRVLFLLFCLLSQVGFLHGAQGRPETLISFLAAATVLAWTFPPSVFNYAIIGISLGLATITSPIPAVYLAMTLVVGILMRFRRISPIASWRSFSYIIIFSAIAFTFAFFFYPYGFLEWINGLIISSKWSYSLVASQEISLLRRLLEYVIYSGRLMNGPIFLLGLFAGFRLLYLNRWSGLAFYFACFVLAILSTVLISQQFYYRLSMFPVFSYLIAIYLTNFHKPYIINLATLFFLAISALDPLLLQIGHLLGYKSTSLSDARDSFALERQKLKGSITMSMDLAVLTENTDNIKLIFSYMPPISDPSTDWLIIQQYNRIVDKMPTYPHYSLWKSNFTESKQISGRLAQWFGANGYGYAIFKRISE